MTIPNAGEDAEKPLLSCIAGGNVNWYCPSEEEFGNFLFYFILFCIFIVESIT